VNSVLNAGQIVYTESSKMPCIIESLLGSGGQGEVYQANLSGQLVALKWYYPEYLKSDVEQRARLQNAIYKGSPSNRFLWPIDLVSSPSINGFGYIMQLRPIQYKNFADLMKRRIDPSFRALVTAGYQLADSFLQLHAQGMCYRDISFGNVFFDPDTGDILICDNDNVAINGEQVTGILGTPRFMAPEIIDGRAKPSSQTDLYSLSVLLFYLLMIHHPLEGASELKIKCLDSPAMNKLYGSEAIFIFHPSDQSNRPVKGYHDNSLIFWPIYTKFIRDLFTKAFTEGIKDAQNGRIRESEWREAMVKLRDSIVYCSNCGEQNFHDFDNNSIDNSRPCWNCNKPINLPTRIRIGRKIVMLNHDSQLFDHHVNPQNLFDFSRPIAQVSQNPSNPSIWGLKNLSDNKWLSTSANGDINYVDPGRSVRLATGIKINFGKEEGEII